MAKGKFSFEESLDRIEQIVVAIEEGKVGLEDSIKQFEEGMKLITQCRTVLSDAEMKIQKLQSGDDGTIKAVNADFETDTE